MVAIFTTATLIYAIHEGEAMKTGAEFACMTAKFGDRNVTKPLSSPRMHNKIHNFSKVWALLKLKNMNL